MLEHRALLVVDEHLGAHAVKPFEATDQALVRVLGVVAISASEVKPARVPQRVHAEVNLGLAAADQRPDLAPVAL
jgi:hypothetical protein